MKRGTDGNYYIPNMGRNSSNIHSYSGSAYNAYSYPVDTMYKLAGGLPTQVYKVFDSNSQIKDFVRSIGNKGYELKDHLGNVRVVISDAKLIIDQDASSTITSSDLFTPEVLNYTDYYAFGMEMPGRQFNYGNYRFGYNKGSEKDDEISGNGNAITTFYRELDTRLGRWWQIDPKSNASESPYVSMGNNPIFNTDALGDSIRKTKSFMEDKGLMNAYDTWAKTRQGKRFLKNYGEGGKFEHIAVVFDNGPLTSKDENGKTHTQDAEGITIFEYVVEKNLINPYLLYNNKGTNSVPSNIQDAMNGKSTNGDYIRFTLKFPGSVSNKGRAAYNLLHETQHLRIHHSDVIKYGAIQHSYYSHKQMDTEPNGYWKESFDFMFQIRDVWIRDYYEQRKNTFGAKTIEQYIRRTTDFWW